MKANKIFIFIYLVFIALSGKTQNITIKGIAKGKSFDQIEIFINDDEFSELRKKVFNSITDENGNFSGTIKLNNSKIAFIKSGLAESEFYLKPGSIYKFTIFPDTSKNITFFNKSYLKYSLTSNDNGLNDSIAEFNILYNTFLIENLETILRTKNKKDVENFEKKTHLRFKDFDNDFFKIYMKYSLGQLEWTTGYMNTKNIFKKYFSQNPVYYDNVQYASFFKDFFKDYINRNFYRKYFDELRHNIYFASTDSLDSILKTDPLLASNAEVRELVLINTLERFYYDKYFSKNGIIKILNDISKNSDYEIHRKIANNYVKKVTKLRQGSKAPDFSLPMSNGKVLSLRDLEGSFVILDFLRSDCKICVKHFDFLKDIQDKIGSKLKIVLLVYGNYSEMISQILEQKGVGWTILYLGKRTDILEDYDIKMFPTYIIITPDGKIGRAPAGMADEKLEQELKMLIYNNKTK